MCLLVPLFLGAAVLIAAEPRKDAAKDDVAKMQGNWTLVSGTRDGKEFSKEDLKSALLVVKGNTFKITSKSGSVGTGAEGTFSLDPSKTPKTIDSTTGGKVSLGIYEVTADEEKVCFAPPGMPRPTEFSSKPGSKHLLQVWKKAK